MNEQLIRDIVDVSANKQVIQLTGDLEKNNKALQDNILAAKQLNDILSQSKGFADYNKNSAASAKAQEQLAKLTAARQLQEEKLAAFRAAEQTKADARAAKEIANEQKVTEAANARTAALERRAKIVSASTQQDISNSISNGGNVISGTTVNAKNISAANAANKASTQTYNQNTQAVNKNILSKKQLALIEAQNKANIAANALALKNQAKELNAAKGSLDQRAAALGRLQKVLSGLNESERASPFGQRLTKTVGQLNTQVLELEKGALGKSGRNVGNYPLFNGIQQGATKAFSALRLVANILPGVGLAGLLGFAVEPIINYVSQLDLFKKKISEIVKTRQMLNDVNLKGAQDAQLEITQLKVLVDTAKNKSLSDELRYDAAKKLQDQYPQTFKNYTIEDILLGKVDGGYRKLTDSILATARARASEQKIAENSSRQLSDEEAVNEERINNERIKREIKTEESLRKISRNSTIKNAQAAQGEETASSETLLSLKKELAKSDKTINDFLTDRNILEKRNLALTENIVKQQQKGAELADPSNTKEKKEKVDTSYIDTLRAEIEAERNAQDVIAKDEQKSLDTRLAALNNFVNLSERLNELDAAKKIKQGKNLGQVRAEQNAEDEKVESDAAERKYKINERAGKDLLDLIKSYSQRELDVENNKNTKILESTNEVLENIENRRAEAQQKLTESYANRTISQKQFEAESLRISNDAAKESLETQIDALQEVIDNEKKFAQFDTSNNKKLAKDQRDLTALKIRLSKLGTDAKIEDLERELQKQKEVRDSIIDFSKEAFDFTKGLASSSFENRLQELDSESKALDKNTKRQIENVNESVASEEDKANQINLINARQEAKQAEIDERVRQTKIRQAKADKAAAIASIIINYAVGYSKNIGILGFLGLPLNAILAATSALQIATVLAQPIPAYKGGKSKGDNYSGSAWVGDGGMSELVIEPNGSMWITPNTPTLTNVSSGTEIISGPDFKRMLAKPNLNSASGGSSIDLSLLVAEQRRNTKETVKAFKDMPVNLQVTTDKGHMFILILLKFRYPS